MRSDGHMIGKCNDVWSISSAIRPNLVLIEGKTFVNITAYFVQSLPEIEAAEELFKPVELSEAID